MGGVCLAGAQEREVSTIVEMAEVLEQGSLARSTASTNMNAQSSRSHAIFTITIEQRKVTCPSSSTDLISEVRAINSETTPDIAVL